MKQKILIHALLVLALAASQASAVTITFDD